MKSSISSETVVIKDKEYTIASVSSSSCSFGICNTTSARDKGIKETFYIGNEALINIIQRSVNDQYSNKVITQISSIDHCGDFSKRVEAVCEDYFNNNKTALSALRPILDYIKNGLYIIYETEMLPTDGAGNFFWPSYMVSHELSGSSTFNPVCRKNYPLLPAFLVPTEAVSAYNDKSIKASMDKVEKEDGAYGLCFHLSGMFCALLSSHHDVTAAVIQNKKIHCLVIEPIRNICFADEVENLAVPGDNPEASHETEETKPNENYLFSCPIKIPFSKVPNSILENFFMVRKNTVDKYTESVTYSSNKPPYLKGKRALPDEITEKCDIMPTGEMLQSAAMIDHLNDEEIDALLRGEIMLNNHYIINKNYYSSITIAFNYLQYKDFGKFLDFAEAVLRNEDLAAVHQFAASRLQSIMHERINRIFTEINESESQVYVPIKSLAEKYLKRYKMYKETADIRKQNSKQQSSKKPSSDGRDALNLSQKIKDVAALNQMASSHEKKN